jgi:hypothetical protein
MTFSLPDSAMHQHIAVLGKTGSGKTSTSKWLIEQHVAAGLRVCVLDPIKSDHWGLTASASGKSAGLPFCILGGPKAHAPLAGKSGAVIGGLVASGALPLSIIDMADLSPNEHAQWYLDFAETLLKRMTGVLVLVMEEADIFAPKERFGNDKENMRLYWSSKMARTGRSKGLRLVVNCTRVQKIHNDMIGSCETLIAHRFTTPADRKPIIEWLSVNAEKPVVKEIEGSLSNLQDGEAWVCYPSGGYIQRQTFPRIKTYDNSKTPVHGAGISEVKTAAIDIDALRSQLGDAVKEAEANDPERLKKRISELERELKAKPAPPPSDDAAVERAVRRAADERDTFWRREIENIKRRQVTLDKLPGLLRDAAATIEAARIGKAAEPPAVTGVVVREARASASLDTGRVRTIVSQAPPRRRRDNGDVSALPPGERATLQALIQYPEGLRREQLTVLTGYKRSSRDAYIFRLAQKGYVDPSGERVTTTPDGIAALPDAEPLPTGQELQDFWMRRLPEGEAKVLQVLIGRYPDAVERSEIDEATGYKRSSRDAYIQRLGAKELVAVERGGNVKASENLF